MHEMDLTADNGDKAYGTLFVNVGLLSADLYRKYRKYIPKYNRWVWLCTPWHCSNPAMDAIVVDTNRILCNTNVENANGVVPAVVFSKYTTVKLKN